MPELIDRHALLKKVYEHTQERERMTDGEWCRKCIYEAPKVEAEPVRRGRWLEDHKQLGSHHYCSVCRTSIYVGIGISFDVTSFLFCPFCGARMDGGADND